MCVCISKGFKMILKDTDACCPKTFCHIKTAHNRISQLSRNKADSPVKVGLEEDGKIMWPFIPFPSPASSGLRVIVSSSRITPVVGMTIFELLTDTPK